MCTIAVRHGMDPWCATIIAANRDEFYDRAWLPPRVLHRTPRVIGGRDEQQGGTWFGLTNEGLFLGLTNQRNYDGYDASLRSRGELVVESLKRGSLSEMRRYLEDLETSDYNEFNLIFGDGDEIWVGYGRRDPRGVELEQLRPGVHVLCNDRLGSSDFPKAGRVRSRITSIPRSTWKRVRERYIEVLSDAALPEPEHMPPVAPGFPFDREVFRRLQAVCIDTPVYGTVSATLAVVEKGRVLQYEFAPGAPSRTEFEDQLHLFGGSRLG